MAELTDRDREYARKVDALQFENKTFNLEELLESAKKISFQAVHEIMVELLAENVERQKKNLKLVGLRMIFRKRAGNFDAKKHNLMEQDNRKQDWEEHLKRVEAEQDAGFTASDDQLISGLVDYRDNNKGIVDDEAYTRGLKFLNSLIIRKVEKPVDQTV